MTAHSLCQHDCVSWFRTQRTLVEQGSAPTSHLALQVLLVEDQRILLQQFVHHNQHVNMLQLLQPLATLVVSRESCLQLGMSDLHCPFSVSCRARSVIVQCWPVAFVAFPHVMFKLLVTNPHRVLHCIPCQRKADTDSDMRGGTTHLLSCVCQLARVTVVAPSAHQFFKNQLSATHGFLFGFLFCGRVQCCDVHG